MAADGTDICERMYDGDPADPRAQEKLIFDNTLPSQIFTSLEIRTSMSSLISITMRRKEDCGRIMIISMCLNSQLSGIQYLPCLHRITPALLRDFMARRPASKRILLNQMLSSWGEQGDQRSEVLACIFGKGFWTYYGGHDPEDYQHTVYEEPTDLNLHPNSPGSDSYSTMFSFLPQKRKSRRRSAMLSMHPVTPRSRFFITSASCISSSFHRFSTWPGSLYSLARAKNVL